MEGRFVELMDQLAKKAVDDVSPGRRWVRKAETLLDGIIECPATWPHEVYIVEVDPPTWSLSDPQYMTVRDASGHRYRLTMSDLRLFFERQGKPRHQRLMEDDDAFELP